MTVVEKITTDSRSVMMIAVAGSVQIQRYCGELLIVLANAVLFFCNDDGCDNGADGSGCKD